MVIGNSYAIVKESVNKVQTNQSYPRGKSGLLYVGLTGMKELWKNNDIDLKHKLNSCYFQPNAHSFLSSPMLSYWYWSSDSSHCNLFIFANRAETTGQIPTLQTVVREEKEAGDGEEPGCSRAKGPFFYWGSVQWSCLCKWGHFEVSNC